MAQRFKIPIQVRFCDTDMLGHINNAAYMQYLELARVEYMHHMRRLGISGWYMVLAHVHMDYIQQVTLEQQVEVETWLTRLGNSSFDLEYHIVADGMVAAKAMSTQVTINLETKRPAPIPEAVRSHLQTWIGE